MVELKSLGKSYDQKVIFDDVNLHLHEGCVNCFVGHNGCGKSTLLKVIAGLIPKSNGEIIFDRKYKISYVPEKFQAVNMSGRKYLQYMTKMDGLYSGKKSEDIIHQFTDEFFLSDMIDKPMKNLSKGTLQKIGVIQALINDPDILLLDEPLSGQDFDSQQVFISKIIELKKKNKIILLSAHERNLINSLSDNIYTIENHKVIPYNEENQRKYKLVIENELQLSPIEGMLVEGDDFIYEIHEQALSPAIDRLLQEGWHIKNIYELTQ